jgi:PAS domain S-box-containing protein
MSNQDQMSELNELLEELKSGAYDREKSPEVIDDLLDKFTNALLKAQPSSDTMWLHDSRPDDRVIDPVKDSDRISAIFSGISLGYLVIDQDGMILEANHEAERLFGARSDRLVKKTIFSLAGPNDRIIRDRFTSAFTQKKSQDFLTTFIGRDGDRFPARVYVTSIPDPGKTTTHLHLIIQDQTLVMRTEEELHYQIQMDEILAGISRRFISVSPRESIAAFQEAIESVGNFVDCDRCSLLLLSDDGMTITRVFEWCREKYDEIGDYLEGTSLEGFPWLLPQLQKGKEVLVPRAEKLPADAKVERQYWKNIRVKMALVLPLILEDHLVGALFLEHTRLRTKWAVASLNMLQTLASLFVNMVARIRDEDELRISEEKFRRVFENFLNPIFIAGDDGRFTDANMAALDFMEQGMEDMAEKNLTEWIPTLRSILPSVPEKRDQKPRVIETDYTIHGKTKTMLLNVVPFPVRGRVLYYGIGQDITDRKRAEREVADARIFAEGIIQAVTPALVVVTDDGRVAFANQSFYHMFSSSRAEVEHIPFWEIPGGGFSPPGLREHIEALFTTGKRIRRFEWVYQGIPGDERVLELNASLISRKAPFRLMAVLVISDVTDQKKLEAAIRESEERYQSLFEDSPLSLWEEDFSGVKEYLGELKASGVRDLRRHFAACPEDLRTAVDMIRVIDVNQATVHLHEAESKEAFLDGVHAVFTPENHAVFLEEFLAFDSGERVYESEIRTVTRKGTEKVLIIRLSIPEGSKGSWDRVIVTLTDISDRKRAEERLRETSEYLDRLITYANAPIIVWNPDLRISRFNRAFEQLTGRSEKDVLGEQIGILFPPETMEQSMGYIRSAAHGLYWKGLELPVLHIDGSVRTVLWNSAPISDSDGKIISVIAQGQDITERKMATEALQRGKELYRYIASFTEENPAPILEVRDDGKVTFANVAAGLALRRRGLPGDPALFFPEDMDGILAELKNGNAGFFYREVIIGDARFGESIYLSPDKKTIRLYAQDLTGLRKDR